MQILAASQYTAEYYAGLRALPRLHSCDLRADRGPLGLIDCMTWLSFGIAHHP